jgi:cell division protein FtsL
MIQRSSVPTIAATAEVAETFRGRLHNEQLAALRRAFALPSTRSGFLMFALGVIIVCVGLAMQVMLSAQIRAVQVENAALRTQVERVGQKNTETMWVIAEATSMERLRARALAIGFKPIEEPIYVVRAADAPAYFGAVSAPLSADASDALLAEPESGVDMAWTSGLVSGLRQRVAESIDALVR